MFGPFCSGKLSVCVCVWGVVVSVCVGGCCIVCVVVGVVLLLDGCV